jgi:ankyrin repeat protein
MPKVGKVGNDKVKFLPEDVPKTMSYMVFNKENKTTWLHEVNLQTDANKIMDDKGNTWLHEAALTGCFAMVQGFFKFGTGKIDWDIRNQNDRTPLFIAAESKNENSLAIAELLIEAGADINASNCGGYDHRKPLYAAALFGNSQVVQLLLEKGAQTFKPNGKTPLLLALSSNTSDTATMEILIDHGENIYGALDNGETAYHLIVQNLETPERIEFVKKYKMNPHQETVNGKSPLHYCHGGNIFFIGMLINAYVIKGIDKKSPITKHTKLYDMCSEGRVDLITKLIENGANIMCPHENGKDTPLSVFVSSGINKIGLLGCQERPNEIADLIKLFISKGAKINLAMQDKLLINHPQRIFGPFSFERPSYDKMSWVFREIPLDCVII